MKKQCLELSIGQINAMLKNGIKVEPKCLSGKYIEKYVCLIETNSVEEDNTVRHYIDK